MPPAFIASQTSIELFGKSVLGAEDRQRRIEGFDQDAFSKSRVVCIGAGGLISFIAPTLVRKGIGTITLLDDDVVEPSNLNRQRFYAADIGQLKAIALSRNLQPECIAATRIRGYGLRFEEAIATGIDLSCDIAICGVDNNPCRVAASRRFRELGIPLITLAVSNDADHGYVFCQEAGGACIGCLYPDMVSDDRHPCPGTPAIAEILQVVGGLAVYAVDSLLMKRPRNWNYRRISLKDGLTDATSQIPVRPSCRICGEKQI